MLVEGNSLRATSRLCDVSINTVTKLLLDVAEGAANYHDSHVRNVRVRRMQCDEIWCFVRAKNKNVTPEQEAQDVVSKRGKSSIEQSYQQSYQQSCLQSYW